MSNNGTTTLILVGIAAALLFGHFGPMGLVMLGVIAFFVMK